MDRNNVDLYPQFQGWLKDSGIPVLAVWGKHDPFFIPPGAEGFGKDVKDFEFEFLDGGHFLLETHLQEVGSRVLKWLEKKW